MVRAFFKVFFAVMLLASAGRAALAEKPVPLVIGSGFFVALKSAPDAETIQREIPVLTEKYGSVFGGVQIISRVADLGPKGEVYRAAAGPLGTMQEAKDLCQKIKGVDGDNACFVTN
jgi:hypothetical protein